MAEQLRLSSAQDRGAVRRGVSRAAEQVKPHTPALELQRPSDQSPVLPDAATAPTSTAASASGSALAPFVAVVSDVVPIKIEDSLKPRLVSDQNSAFHRLVAILNAQQYILLKKPMVLDSQHMQSPRNVYATATGLSQETHVMVEACLNRVRDIGQLAAAECAVEVAVEVGADIEELIQQSRKVSTDAVRAVRLVLANAVLDAVGGRGTEDEAVFTLSHLLLCLCRDSKQGAELVARVVLQKSALCWPCLAPIWETQGESVAVTLEGHVRFVSLFATLVASSEFSSVFRKEEGWSWLIRIGKALHRAAKLLSQGSDAAVIVSIRLGLSAVDKFLRICGRTLYLEYGPNNMDDALSGLLSVCKNISEIKSFKADEVEELLRFLKALQSGGNIVFLSLKSQPPFVMAAKAYARSLLIPNYILPP